MVEDQRLITVSIINQPEQEGIEREANLKVKKLLMNLKLLSKWLIMF